MRSKAILEQLKLNAYTGEAAALGDALGDMVHWLAEHQDNLGERDITTLMSVCLALYKNELEKSWDVSVHDIPEPPLDSMGSLGLLGLITGATRIAASSVQDAAQSNAAATGDSAQTHVENAIEAMVALRRPAPEAASIAGPLVSRRRRWTDSECWSLTLRT